MKVPSVHQQKNKKERHNKMKWSVPCMLLWVSHKQRPFSEKNSFALHSIWGFFCSFTPVLRVFFPDLNITSPFWAPMSWTAHKQPGWWKHIWSITKNETGTGCARTVLNLQKLKQSIHSLGGNITMCLEILSQIMSSVTWWRSRS